MTKKSNGKNSAMTNEGVTLTTDRIIGILVIVALSYFGFKDQTIETATSSQVDIAELTIQVRDLKEAVANLEETSQPQFTDQDYSIRIQPLLQRLERIEGERQRIRTELEDLKLMSQRRESIIDDQSEDIVWLKEKYRELSNRVDDVE